MKGLGLIIKLNLKKTEASLKKKAGQDQNLSQENKQKLSMKHIKR